MDANRLISRLKRRLTGLTDGSDDSTLITYDIPHDLRLPVRDQGPHRLSCRFGFYVPLIFVSAASASFVIWGAASEFRVRTDAIAVVMTVCLLTLAFIVVSGFSKAGVVSGRDPRSIDTRLIAAGEVSARAKHRHVTPAAPYVT